MMFLTATGMCVCVYVCMDSEEVKKQDFVPS